MPWLRRVTRSLPLAVWAFLGLLLALVPAAIVQVLLEREARLERTQQLADDAMRFVRLIGQQQSSITEAAWQVLSSVGAHDAVRALRPSAECDAFLDRIVAANPRYLTASVFDRQGDPLCHAPDAPHAINIAGRPYFTRTLGENSFQVGGFMPGPGTRQRSLHFAAPLRNEAGQPVGVILLALSVDWLVAELQSVALPPGSASTIADRDGVILARSVDAERFVGTMLPPFALAMLNASAPGILDAPALDGVRRVAAFLPVTVEPIGLFVTVGLEANSVLGSALRADRRAALLIFASLMLTFCLAILLFHAAVERPVRRLLATIRSWEAQDWAARVGAITSGREFRKLGEAFDAMAESVTSREAARLRAQTRMQAVVAVAPQIILTANDAGEVDWANPYWEEHTGLTLTQSRGDGWLEAVHPDDRDGAAEAWREALATAELGSTAPFSREMRICHAAQKQWRWFLFTGAPIRAASGRPISWTAVGLDYHERRQAEADRAESAARLRATYESAPAGLSLMNPELRFIAINDTQAEIHGQPAAAHIGQALGRMAPHIAEIVGPIMRQVLETGQPVEAFELTSLVHGEQRSWLCSYFPVRSDAGEITGVSAAMVDITARKRIEASERVLSREVDHRAQNVLSVVHGLIRLSVAEVEHDVVALVAALEGRISALSRLHNVLALERWVSAEMEEILQQELKSVSGQVSMAGPTLRINADAAQPFALIVHELVTNSVKYGALSNPAGRLTLRWRIHGDQVVLDWIESGGPDITAAPTRAGLGSMLIEANAGAQLAGHMERRWLRKGLHGVLTMGASAFAGGLGPQLFMGTPTLRGRSVLIADDQPERAAYIASTLRAAGCTVLGPATTIADALTELEAAGSVAVALLPQTLQGVSVQLLWQALERRAVATLELGSPGPIGRTENANMVLQEPFTADELLAAVAAARLQPGRPA